jgi:hypothetical protein
MGRLHHCLARADLHTNSDAESPMDGSWRSDCGSSSHCNTDYEFDGAANKPLVWTCSSTGSGAALHVLLVPGIPTRAKGTTPIGLNSLRELASTSEPGFVGGYCAFPAVTGYEKTAPSTVTIRSEYVTPGVIVARNWLMIILHDC